MEDGRITIGTVDFLSIEAYQRTDIELPKKEKGKPRIRGVQRGIYVLDTRVDPPHRIVSDGWDWEFIEENILDDLVRHGYVDQWLRVSREIRVFLRNELGASFSETGFSEGVTIRDADEMSAEDRRMMGSDE